MRPEHHALATELEEIFRKSLRDYSSAAECTDLWKKSDADGKAETFLELNARAADVFLNGGSRTAVINDPSLVHVFWLLKIDATKVQFYVDLLLQNTISRSFPNTKFWVAYSRAVGFFSGAKVPADAKPKLVGYEKFWEPYLDFMAGNISNEDFVIRAANSFASRNQQSRNIDWRSLDGDEKNPVKWDFRHASIMQKAKLSIGQI